MHLRLISFVLLVCCTHTFAQQKDFNIIAYYSAGPEQVAQIPAEKLTHIIFSFCHLNGNKLTIDNARDSLTLTSLVKLKSRNPKLKVILSLGGWGGCASCSDVFNTEAGRNEFASSTLALFKSFKVDGIDLDWEYPTIEGHPGHTYRAEDKKNFTELTKQLRKTVGEKYELSFAAGGFQKFLDESVEWKEVMAIMDRVNIMSYDLVNGYSTVTGHHTPLYSNQQTTESTDKAVQYLIKLGIPRNKLVIGAAFYARVWEDVPDTNNGLYQSGKFKGAVDYKNFNEKLSTTNGYTFYWDDETKAPYAYNSSQKLFATFDDIKSVKAKTQYVIDQQLDGIMFWELSLDKPTDGLLDAIAKMKQ